MNDLTLYFIITAVSSGALGILIGLLLSAANLARSFKKNPDAFINAFIKYRETLIRSQGEELGLDYVALYLDQVDDKIMVYETNTDRFVVQGDTEVDVIKEAQERFPNKVVLFNVDRLYPELVNGDPEVIKAAIEKIYDKLD